VTWYHEVRDATSQTEDAAQLFLGLRIQCARCHHHPFERWSQADYYGLAAFFSRVGRKPSDLGNGKDSIFHNPGIASATNPKGNQAVKPKGLGDSPRDIPADEDPRVQLADWMTDPANPFFARAVVNRYWKHFFGQGIVEPEDDMRVTNPPSNPQLLDGLSQHFVESGYDLKELVRTICTSKTYQLSAVANEHNATDTRNFSRFYPRRLNAEVLSDAIDTLTKAQTRFAGVPLGTRAVQLPDNAFDSYFLSVFGRPNSASACECERSTDTTLAQSLHLLNAKGITEKVAGRRVQELAQDQRPLDERIRELYVIAFSREASPEEVQTAVGYIEAEGRTPQTGFEDLVWVTMNTKEFLFNH
jgi:hypothetical protein